MLKAERKDFYATKKKSAESSWSVLYELMDSEWVSEIYFIFFKWHSCNSIN